MERPDAPRGIALIAHPHPLGGGANTNKVAYTLARTFVGLGYATFRPNFRGVVRVNPAFGGWWWSIWSWVPSPSRLRRRAGCWRDDPAFDPPSPALDCAGGLLRSTGYRGRKSGGCGRAITGCVAAGGAGVFQSLGARLRHCCRAWRRWLPVPAIQTSACRMSCGCVLKTNNPCKHGRQGRYCQHLSEKVCYFYPAAVPTASFLNLFK